MKSHNKVIGPNICMVWGAKLHDMCTLSFAFYIGRTLSSVNNNTKQKYTKKNDTGNIDSTHTNTSFTALKVDCKLNVVYKGN